MKNGKISLVLITAAVFLFLGSCSKLEELISARAPVTQPRDEVLKKATAAAMAASDAETAVVVAVKAHPQPEKIKKPVAVNPAKKAEEEDLFPPMPPYLQEDPFPPAPPPQF